MSEHQEWKMLHLLYRCSHAGSSGQHRVLTEDELRRAGVHCEMDTWIPMMDAGVVGCEGNEWYLTRPTREILRHFIVAKLPGPRIDIRVDYPEAFVVMPFSEAWSDQVFDHMIVPAVEGANFAVTRGDTIARLGDLKDNVWKAITQAGVIVAECSAPNPNVYYELGLAAALGKPIFLCKQAGVTLPADFGGAHYCEYDLNDLDAGRQSLRAALVSWADEQDHQHFGVKDLEDSR